MKETFFSNLPFNELSEKERIIILSEMTEVEYEQQRKMLNIAKKIKQNENSLLPDSKVKRKLLSSFGNEAKVISFRNSKVAVAATLLLSLCLYFLIKDTDNQTDTIENIAKVENQNKTDLSNQLPNIEKEIVVTKKQIYHKTKMKIDPMLATELDIAQTFKRENQNLNWESDEEEELNYSENLIPCTK